MNNVFEIFQDELTGKEWDVKAKSIINATGPFTDSIRKMDDQTIKEICCPSSGVHIVLPGYYRYQNYTNIPWRQPHL